MIYLKMKIIIQVNYYIMLIRVELNLIYNFFKLYFYNIISILIILYLKQILINLKIIIIK